MPVDQRRINGPEVSVPYEIYVDSALKRDRRTYDLEKRPDGRKHDELRKIFLKTGVVSQAKGSAYVEMGDTKVVCSVFDPREVPNKSGYCVQGEIFCEFKFAPFSCRKRKIQQQDAEEKQCSLILQRALEPAVCLHEFPNFQVDVYATVLDNGGSALAAAIMAAGVAMANAGVPMFGLVTACTVGIHAENFLLDPTDLEESVCEAPPESEDGSTNHGTVTQAYLPQHGQVSETFMSGCVDVESLVRATNVLRTANSEILPVVQQCLVKTVLKMYK